MVLRRRQSRRHYGAAVFGGGSSALDCLIERVRRGRRRGQHGPRAVPGELADLRAATEHGPAALLFYAYTQPSPAVVKALGELGIPCYPTPVRAARALARAAEYAQFLEDGVA